VSNGTLQSRKETSEAQPMEIELRPILLVSEYSHDEPTLSRPQFQTIGQTFAAKLFSLRFFAYHGRAILSKSYALWPQRRFAHNEYFE
jgi:hypothetical protein